MLTLISSPHGVTTLTLDRPDKHNALDGAAWRELHDALLATGNDESTRVVVLTGAGATFCAGADIAHMRSMMNASEEANFADATVLADCLRVLNQLPQPVIARVNGNAFGGGVGLVACADIAIAVSTAKFALTEVRLGIVPAAISPYVIAAIGERQARRLFTTAAPFDAREAGALGLVHLAVEDSQLDAAIERQIDLLLRGGPLAVREAKKLVRDAASASDPTAFSERAVRLLARLRASPEGREGLSAFLERRKPDWQK